MKKNLGFTLIELMIVVAIVAIIAVFAYPAYQDYVLKSNRAAGKAELMKVSTRQEQFRANNQRYADDLEDLGYPSDPYYVNARGDVSSAGEARYLIDLTAAANGFSYAVRARPENTQVDDTSCRALGLDNRGRKFQQVTGNSGGEITGTAANNDCW